MNEIEEFLLIHICQFIETKKTNWLWPPPPPPPPFFFYPKTSFVFLSGYILHDIYYSASNQTHNRMVRMCITIVYLADETNDRNILHNKNKEFSSSIYSGNNKLLR